MNKSLLLPALMALLFSCSTPVQEDLSPEADPVREQFIKVNRYMQRRHQDHIAAFVARVGWEARVSPSGLWVVEDETGKGPLINDGDRVSMTFSSFLLDGTPCYEAPEEDPLQIVVGKGGVESGVKEALVRLRKGSKATLLIPPHLGHGNFGDRDKIPGNSVLLYKLEVLEVHAGQ